MIEGLEIDVSSYIKTDMARNNWHVGAGQNEGLNWADEMSQVPAEVLEGHSATGVKVHSSWFKDYITDALWVILGYDTGEGSFAIRLQQYFHAAGAGYGATWQVWDNEWKDLGQDASQYTWKFKSIRVVAQPNLSNPGATVKVTVDYL